MSNPSDAAGDNSPRQKARELILRGLGARRVADWAGVSEATVYQWLTRGTDVEPIPAARVPAIIWGARAEGFSAPLEILAPELAAALASGEPLQ